MGCAQVEEETAILRWYKARHLGKNAADVQLDAWDRLYYMAKAKARGHHHLLAVSFSSSRAAHHHLLMWR